MKPMLAADWDESKIRFPVIAQPKIDGVRGLNTSGTLTGRSLKLLKNVHTGRLYSSEGLIGFDGELAAGPETHHDLCRMTTSAVGTITGEPFTLWWVFDYITPRTSQLPYMTRYNLMVERVTHLQLTGGKPAFGHLRVVPYKLIHNMDDLIAYDDRNLEAGYEGTIIRDPHGKHKQGRSTVREGGLLRIKRFIDAEATVLSITEGKKNQNPAQENELGNQFRSSHQENMILNGLVGSMECQVLADVKNGNTVVITKDQVVTVSPGNMDHGDRAYYFMNQHELVGKVIKFKFFPKGIKDKPRFPTFVTIRPPEDM